MPRPLIPVLGRLLREPALVGELVAKVQARFTDRQRRKDVGLYAALAGPLAGGLPRVLEVAEAEVRRVLETGSFRALLTELADYDVPSPAQRMGGAAYLEACYAIVRLTRPQVVVETGVAHGYSSAVILQALAENGQGRLFSVDLPMFGSEVTSYTGGAVPARLRSSGAWELILGPDRRVLPPLLRRLGGVDFFLYDSDKSYAGMLRTTRLMWDHLRPGGVLMVDDVHAHDAFLDLTRGLALTPVIVSKPIGGRIYRWSAVYYAGLLRKPPGNRT